MSSEITLQDVRSFIELTSGAADPGWIETVMTEYAALFDHGGLFGVKLTAPSSPAVVALMLAGLLTPRFSRHLLSSPFPYAKALAYEDIRRGLDVIHPDLDRNPTPVAKESADNGVHLHFFCFGYVEPVTGPLSLRYRALISQRFCELYSGMRLRFITLEATGAEWIAEASKNGFHVVSDYRDVYGPDELYPTILMGVDRAQANVSGNSSLVQFFAPGMPSIRLSDRQRHILFHFRAGYSDAEIAEKVFLSQKSMKTYWDRIYDAFERAVPDLFTDENKRRAVDRYIQMYPEEVWPCAAALKRGNLLI